jgi:hypothetical protein
MRTLSLVSQMAKWGAICCFLSGIGPIYGEVPQGFLASHGLPESTLSVLGVGSDSNLYFNQVDPEGVWKKWVKVSGFNTRLAVNAFFDPLNEGQMGVVGVSSSTNEVMMASRNKWLDWTSWNPIPGTLIIKPPYLISSSAINNSVPILYR